MRLESPQPGPREALSSCFIVISSSFPFSSPTARWQIEEEKKLRNGRNKKESIFFHFFHSVFFFFNPK